MPDRAYRGKIWERRRCIHHHSKSTDAEPVKRCCAIVANYSSLLPAGRNDGIGAFNKKLLAFYQYVTKIRPLGQFATQYMSDPESKEFVVIAREEADKAFEGFKSYTNLFEALLNQIRDPKEGKNITLEPEFQGDNPESLSEHVVQDTELLREQLRAFYGLILVNAPW